MPLLCKYCIHMHILTMTYISIFFISAVLTKPINTRYGVRHVVFFFSWDRMWSLGGSLSKERQVWSVYRNRISRLLIRAGSLLRLDKNVSYNTFSYHFSSFISKKTFCSRLPVKILNINLMYYIMRQKVIGDINIYLSW